MSKININKINLFTITILGSFFEVPAFTQCDSTCLGLDIESMQLFEFKHISEVATRPRTEAPPAPPVTTSLLPPPPPPAPAAYVPPAGWVQNCSYDGGNFVGTNVFQTQGIQIVNDDPNFTLYNHNHMILAGMAASAPPNTHSYVKNNRVLEIVGLPNNSGVFKPQYAAREYNAGTLKHSGSFANSVPPVNQHYAWSMHPNGWATFEICNYTSPPIPPAPPPAPPVPVPPGSSPAGQVGGAGNLKINIGWNGSEDIDIRVSDPYGYHYGWFGDTTSSGCRGNGCWDVDNTGWANSSDSAYPNQENVYYPNNVAQGRYIVRLYRYAGNYFTQARISVTYGGVNQSVFMPYAFTSYSTRVPYPVYGVIDITSTGFNLYLMQ